MGKLNMNQILEAMARAAWHETIGTEPGMLLPQWDDLTPRSQRELMDSMRAALIALRDCEVTGAMYIAWSKDNSTTAQEDWHNMINAILEDE